VIEKNRAYKVYTLAMTPRTKEYFPPLEQQLEGIAESFRQEYGEEPQEMLVGLLRQREQTFIRTGEVYIPIPGEASAQAFPLERHLFSTGYGDGSVDPSVKHLAGKV
jgi:hypothetical protein